MHNFNLVSNLILIILKNTKKRNTENLQKLSNSTSSFFQLEFDKIVPFAHTNTRSNIKYGNWAGRKHGFFKYESHKKIQQIREKKQANGIQ